MYTAYLLKLIKSMINVDLWAFLIYFAYVFDTHVRQNVTTMKETPNRIQTYKIYICLYLGKCYTYIII